MEEVNNNKSYETKKILGLIVLIVGVVFCVSTATFAYLAASATNSNVIKGNMTNVSLGLQVTRVSPSNTKWNASTTTKTMVPQYSDVHNKIAALTNAMNSTNDCVDANGNVICQVYQISVSNPANSATIYIDGDITFSVTAMKHLYWKRVGGTNTIMSGTQYYPTHLFSGSNVAYSAAESNLGSTTGTKGAYSSFVNTSHESDVLSGTSYDGAIASGATKNYYIVIWVEEMDYDQNSTTTTATSNNDNGSFTATVEVKTANGGVTSTIVG